MHKILVFNDKHCFEPCDSDVNVTNRVVFYPWQLKKVPNIFQQVVHQQVSRHLEHTPYHVHVINPCFPSGPQNKNMNPNKFTPLRKASLSYPEAAAAFALQLAQLLLEAAFSQLSVAVMA